MVGLPGWKIIPDNFQLNHQTTIRATMRSTIRRIRLGNPQGARDPETGRTTFPAPWPAYEGPARIQSRGDGSNKGGTTVVGDRVVTPAPYLVAEPADSAPALLGDVIEVMECHDSPALVGLKLAVVDVSHADTAWQRNYSCKLHEPTIRR